MENEKKTAVNWWAMLAAFLLGAVLGYVISPVKRGFNIRNYNGNYNYFKKRPRHEEREGDDLCDYDFDDYYDDDLQFRDDEDSTLDDETQSFSF